MPDLLIATLFPDMSLQEGTSLQNNKELWIGVDLISFPFLFQCCAAVTESYIIVCSLTLNVTKNKKISGIHLAMGIEPLKPGYCQTNSCICKEIYVAVEQSLFTVAFEHLANFSIKIYSNNMSN